MVIKRLLLSCFMISWIICSGCSQKVVYKDVPEGYICKPKADVYRLMDEATRLKIELKRCLGEQDKGVK